MDNHNSKKYHFFFQGTNGTGVLLVHGITGTPSEMRYLAQCLNRAGFSVFCNTLPRHCSTLNELKKVTWQEIADSCEADFKFLKKQCPRVFVGGLSMGALMAIHLAYNFPADVSGIIALAPTVFYDGWALHKGKALMPIVWHIPLIRNMINIREGPPYGLKDPDLRENIERFYKHADAAKFSNKVFLFGSPFFPMANLYQHHLFSKMVKKEFSSVKTPILIIHAQEDDMTSVKNAQYVFEHIGSPKKFLLILNDSYHMVTIDKQKEKVAAETIKFLNGI